MGGYHRKAKRDFVHVKDENETRIICWIYGPEDVENDPWSILRMWEQNVFKHNVSTHIKHV